MYTEAFMLNWLCGIQHTYPNIHTQSCVDGCAMQFILRREVLCLYRQFLRVSRDVGGVREREEMRRWVRGEFDKWRHISDDVRGSPFSSWSQVYTQSQPLLAHEPLLCRENFYLHNT